MSSHHIDVVTVDEELALRSIRAAAVPFSFDADDQELRRIVESFEFERFVAPLDGSHVVGSVSATVERRGFLRERPATERRATGRRTPRSTSRTAQDLFAG